MNKMKSILEAIWNYIKPSKLEVLGMIVIVIICAFLYSKGLFFGS